VREHDPELVVQLVEQPTHFSRGHRLARPWVSEARRQDHACPIVLAEPA
jgi:hypothetical protein